MPLIGVARHVVVADTDEEALAIARRAYPRWRDSFRWLFARHGAEPRIAGALSADVRRAHGDRQRRRRIARDRARFHRRGDRGDRRNYLLSWFAFGDMTLAESLPSLELFSREVMPAFADMRVDAA